MSGNALRVLVAIFATFPEFGGNLQTLNLSNGNLDENILFELIGHLLNKYPNLNLIDLSRNLIQESTVQRLEQTIKQVQLSNNRFQMLISPFDARRWASPSKLEDD